MKGDGEYKLIFGFVFLVAFILFITTSAAQSGIQLDIFSGFNPVLFSFALLTVAGTCVVATGLPCLGALIAFNGFTFFTSGNAVLISLLLSPIIITISFIVAARLGRGSSSG